MSAYRSPSSRIAATTGRALLLSLITLFISTFARADKIQLSSSPAPITLHFKNASLQDVTAEITKQTSLEFINNIASAQTAEITLDANKEPLWGVLDKLAAQLHGSFDIAYTGSPEIVLNGNASGSGQQLISGPLLARFQQIDRNTRLTAAAGSADTCNISLNLFWDPRLDVLFFEPTSFPSVAQDEKGVSLVMPVPKSNGDMYGNYRPRNEMGSMSQVGINIPIGVPQKAGRKIAHLQGEIKVWVTGTTAVADLDNIKSITGKNGASVQLADMGTVKLQNGTINVSNISFQVEIERPAAESEDNWTRRRMLVQGIHCRAYDSDGKLWGENQGINGWGWGGKQMQVYINVSRAEGVTTTPTKLSLEAAVTAQEVSLPYDFKDLPLP